MVTKGQRGTRLPPLTCLCDELDTCGTPPLGPLATPLASQQFLLDFTQLLLTSATLFFGFRRLKWDVVRLLPDRYSNEPAVRWKALTCLSSHQSKRQSGAFFLWRCTISTQAPPPCWPENKWKANLFWQKLFPAPASGAFALVDPPYAGCYLDELCLGAQPRPVSRVKCLKVGPKPSGCAFVSPSLWNNDGWDKPLCLR